MSTPVIGTETGTGNGQVQVAYLHPPRVSHSWHVSMTGMLMHDLAHDARMIGTGGPLMKNSTSGALVQDRNWCTARFLDHTPHEWLLFIDCDMGFAPDSLDRLLEVADPATRPVVGALCFILEDVALDGMGGRRMTAAPTLYQLARKPSGEVSMVMRKHYPPDTVLPVAGTGAAFLLIHRTALEKLRAEWGDHWFDEIRTARDERVGEDLAFCGRLGAAGIPIHVHTGVRTTHHKDVWVGVEDYRPAESGSTGVPPATEETAVIVPVMRRPANAAPFMASLRASTGLATVYAVADHDDAGTIAAWRQAGATVLIRDGRAGTFAEKVNHGYRHTTEPWLFLVGDDVRFQAGWLDQAQHTAQATGARVIGTNDLGNPRVIAGEHATHVLVSRAYIDEQGASWDGPGVVAHEGYGHWFVDDEIVLAAVRRGVWAMAGESIVEHLHPLYGKAESDEVYRLGQSHAEHDRELFERRVAEHA